jgi:hypothetical protein
MLQRLHGAVEMKPKGPVCVLDAGDRAGTSHAVWAGRGSARVCNTVIRREDGGGFAPNGVRRIHFVATIGEPIVRPSLGRALGVRCARHVCTPSVLGSVRARWEWALPLPLEIILVRKANL